MAKAKAKGGSTLTVLCRAVGEYYKEEGDQGRAGVVISSLNDEPSVFYASVARYPESVHRKVIVVSSSRQHVKFQAETVYKTAEEAVAELARQWYALVKPARVEETLSDLEQVLNTLPEQ